MFENKRNLFGIVSDKRVKHRARPGSVYDKLVSGPVQIGRLLTDNGEQLVQWDVKFYSDRGFLIERQVHLHSVG